MLLGAIWLVTFPRYGRVITEFMVLLVLNSLDCVNIVSDLNACHEVRMQNEDHSRSAWNSKSGTFAGD